MRLLPPEPDDDREAKTLTLPATPPRADNVDGHTQGAPPVAAEGAPPVPAASLTERWPKNFGKIVLVLVTVLLVVVIVAIIRKSADTGSSSNSLSPTKVTQKKPAPTTTTTPATSIPVSSSVLSAFTTASLNLDAANATVTRELAGGASQSVGQVAQEVAPYVTALNTFNFQTHSLAWPTSLQVPSSDVTLRTNELISYLSSVSTATPATLPAWFAQFHALARVTEQEDNVLRAYLGLAPTTSYPTK
jgi:hypothetical protein